MGNDIRDNAAGIYSQLTGDPVPKPYFILNERKDGLILKNYPYKGELAGSFIDELNKPISIFGYKPFRLFSLKVLRLHENLIHQIWKYKISPIIRRKQENSLKQEKEILDRLFGPLFVENPSQYWVDALKITEMLILKLKNEVENDGAAFGVVIIPTREQMEKSEENDHGLYTVDERLLSFLDKNDVKHLYLYPEFKKVHKIHAELYEGGVHWNSAGHSVASFHVAKWLSSDFTIKKGKAEEWKWD
ncbi:MAG TPA: hypothetical protein ENI77_00510 [Nitrospirae bacterium]|nr:hypothetical protein [Nitrospirota bacterium]